MQPSMQELGQTYGVSLKEIKERIKQDLNFLGALVLGVLFRCDFSEMHLAFFDLMSSGLREISLENVSQLALGLPRGFCKTTMLKLYVVWVILFTDIRYILVVSKSKDLAENFIADVTGFLDNPYIVQIFGNWRAGLSRDTLDLKNFSFDYYREVDGKQVREVIPRVLQAIGAEGAVRGVNINNERPELIICEDIQSKECADSPTQNEQLILWFLGTLLKCKSSVRFQCVFLGNMYNEQCLLNRLRNSPEWLSFIAPGILEGRISLWPEFRSYESLMKEFANDISLGHPEVFLAEVMNDAEATAAANIDFSTVPAWPYDDRDFPDGAFLTIDPATGTKDKIPGDMTAITLHWIVDGKCCTRKIKADHWNEDDTVREALIFALQEGCSLIAIECVAFQVILYNLFVKHFNALNISGISVVPCAPHGRSKNARMKDYLKRLVDGSNPIHPEARPEMFYYLSRIKWTKTKNEDDVPDSASYGEEVFQVHWHEITYNGNNYDHTFANAHVWPTELCSPF